MTTDDIIARMKASSDVEEIRRLRIVLRKRLAPPPVPAAVEVRPPDRSTPADDLAEVHRIEREQWGAIPGKVGARIRHPMTAVVTPWD